MNAYHNISVIDGLYNPNRKAKVTYSNGTPPEQRSRTMRDVLMEIQVPDTPEGKTWDFAIEAVLPINSGADVGGTYITHFNDQKNALVKRGVHRVTQGPVTTLVSKLKGPDGASWLYWYM